MATAKDELGIVFLEFDWEDSTSYSIPEEDLVRCVQFIHEARRNGGSVLVYCAQVRTCRADPWNQGKVAHIQTVGKQNSWKAAIFQGLEQMECSQMH